MNEEALTRSVTNRLLSYFHLINKMAKEGLQMTSSSTLAERTGHKASVVSRDLAIIGSSEISGENYSIYQLLEYLPHELRLDRIWKVVIIGMRGFGYALANDQRFAKQGLEIALLFDDDPKIVGTKVGSHMINHGDLMEEKLDGKDVQLAILTNLDSSVQMIANRLIQTGIRGIINFTQEKLIVPNNVQVHYLDPLMQIQQMIPYLDVR